jgi:hypothetical protein
LGSILGIAAQHPRHLSEAETERTQGCDLGGAGHLVGTIGSPSGRSTGGDDQAALLVEPQGLCRHAEPLGSFGRVQELGERFHESPLYWLTALLIRAVPGAGSTEFFPRKSASNIRKRFFLADELVGPRPMAVNLSARAISSGNLVVLFPIDPPGRSNCSTVGRHRRDPQRSRVNRAFC